MLLQFDISLFPSRYAMHCPTPETAKLFCDYLASIGRKWNNGDSYLSETNYHSHTTETAYVFNSGQYGSINACEECGFQILDIYDFIISPDKNHRVTITEKDFYDIIESAG